MFGVNFFLKNNLKHKEASVRLAALEQVSPVEKDLLFEVALEDPEPELRIAAAAKLEEEELLEKLLAGEQDASVITFLKDKLNRRYSGMVMSGAPDADISCYINKIDDENLLATIACSGISHNASALAAARVKSKEQIIKMLRNIQDDNLAHELLAKLDDEESLEMAAASSYSERIRKTAAEKLKEFQSCETEQLQSAEEEAQKTSGMPHDLKILIHEREKLCENIENAAGHQDTETVRCVEQWKLEWETLELLHPRYMEILDKRFKNACIKFEDGIKEAVQKAAVRKEKIGLLDDICIKAESLASLDAVCDIKQVHILEEAWKKTASGLQDIELMEPKFYSACEKIRTKIKDEQKNIADAVTTLKEACDEIQDFINDNEPEKLKERRIELEKIVKLASSAIPDGNNDKQRLTAEFFHRNKKYSALLHSRYETRDFERWEHYTLKLDLCRFAEALLNVQDMHEVSRKLKELRERWQKLGHVPPEKSEEIWARFKAAGDVLQQRCNDFFEKLNKERDEAARRKTVICEEAELLCNSTEWGETAEKIKALQARWKESGSCNLHIEKELYQRFRSACDIFFNARKAYYDSIRDAREQNAQFKKSLCDEAAKLTELPHAEARRKVKLLWEQWKTAGHAGKDESRLYECFRNVFDKFYSAMREERSANYEKMQQLCNELEMLLNSTDDAATLREKQKQINDGWRSIGEIPRNQEDEMCRRFESLNISLKKVIARERNIKNRNLIVGAGAREKLIASLLDAFAAGNTGILDTVKAEWDSLGQIQPELSNMESLFNKTCDAFTVGNNAFFDDLAAKQPAALKTRKQLCTEMEQIAGCASTAAAEENSPLSNEALADELRAAFLNNFTSVTVPRDAEPLDLNAKIKKIRSKWLAAGIAPSLEIEPLTARFINADDAASLKNG